MENNKYKRRDFLGNMMKAGAAGVMIPHSLNVLITAKNLTVNQVIEKILAELPQSRSNETVDTLKSGSGDQIVTGIVTTMFPTVQVIREAIKIKANFIIAHEPSYYNHLDNTHWVENNMVVKEKKNYWKKTGLRSGVFTTTGTV